MTEIDLLNLFNTFMDAMFARLNDFMAGTFAMLIAAYFAGPRLSPKMAKLLIFLYTLFVVSTAIPIMMSTNRFVRAAEQLEMIANRPGSIVNELFPFFPSASVVLPIMATLIVGGYLGTVLFFVQARKHAE